MAAAWCSTCALQGSRARTPGSMRCARWASAISVLLAVVDGNPGLAAALRVQWPQMVLQRCTNHKLWNLLAKAPAHLREELAEDYRRMIYGESREASSTRGLVLPASGSCVARPSAPASRRPSTNFSLYRFSDFAMEGAAHHQRPGANQRGISAADQDPGFAPQRGGGFVLAFRPPAQWTSYSAPPCRLARLSHHQRTTGGCIVTT